MSRNLKKYRAEDDNMNQFQDSLEGTLQPLLSSDVLYGNLIKDVTLASGDNTISHLLGKPYQGYIVVKRSAAVDIYDKSADTDNKFKDRNLILNSSGAATVSLYIF